MLVTSQKLIPLSLKFQLKLPIKNQLKRHIYCRGNIETGTELLCSLKVYDARKVCRKFSNKTVIYDLN